MPPGEQTLPEKQQGYTLVVVLLLLFSMSLALSIAGPSYAVKAQRDKEVELMRIGKLYAAAIQAYYDGAPGSLKRYPDELRQLLNDQRYVGGVRHLRQLYPDPIQPDQPWGLETDYDGRIVGVYSTSALPALAQGPMQAKGDLPTRYSDWKFIAKTAQR